LMIFRHCSSRFGFRKLILMPHI